MMRPDAVQPGWDEKPSTRSKRIIPITVAIAGLCAASCLTLYQLEVVPSFIGGEDRRSTPPWTVLALGIVILGWGVKEPPAAFRHLERVRAKGGSVWRALRRTGNRHA